MRRTRTVARAGARDKSSVVSLLLALLAATAAPAAVAAQVAPDEAWRTLETEHFRVTFPADLEALAIRAADVAESARARLGPVLVQPPDERVEIVLTDHIDASNGLARVAPYPLVIVFARPPVDGFALSQFDDWIDLVITHELAHIVHLDVTGGLGRVLRSIFGRVPAAWPFFPGSSAPRWVVEGLATWYETRLTGWGRAEGTFFDMILRTAALEGGLEGVDQASGLSPAWPSGQRPYAYGARFFDWLLARYGEERMAAFVDAVGSQWIPYRLNAAARSAFGVSFSDAWSTWTSEQTEAARAVARAADARAPAPVLEELTDGAREGLRPRVGPDGTLAWTRDDGRSDSQIRLRPVEADEGGEVGVRTNGAVAFDWAPDGSVVFSQFELEDRYRAWKDLYRLAPDGSVRRLTRGERLDQPSVGPDGSWAWAVQTVPGRTELVRVRLESGVVEPLPGLPPGGTWGFPAVSPDGGRVAAVLWRDDRGADLVLLDPADGSLLQEVTSDAALDLAPAWAPDGTLLWVSDRTGVPNVYASPHADAPGAARGPVLQVTDVATGVAFPSVDPEGRWIHLSVYHADGWEVARLPYRPDEWAEPLPAAAIYQTVSASAQARPVEADVASPDPGPFTGEVRRYRPWPTLRPRYWEPHVLPEVSTRGRRVLAPFLGASTSLEDAVGRHALGLSAALSTTGAELQGSLAYTFRGLGSPHLAIGIGQSWDAAGPLLAQREEGAPVDTLFVRERERRAGVDATFTLQRWRWAAALGLGGAMVWEDRALLDVRLEETGAYRLTRPSARLADARASLTVGTARRHELSISPEEGVVGFVRLRRRTELGLPDSLGGVPGGDRGFEEVLARVRLYQSVRGPGFADHVLALQVVGGAARGPGADAFHFDVGGAQGELEGITGLGLFGGQSFLFPVRGYSDGDRSGRHAWAASAEWRFPLALVNRGAGLAPLHLDRLHGALFADAGNAWGPELGISGYQRPREEALIGVGAELRAELLAFFTVPMALRLGLAAPLVQRDGVQVYVRFGAAF